MHAEKSQTVMGRRGLTFNLQPSAACCRLLPTASAYCLGESERRLAPDNGVLDPVQARVQVVEPLLHFGAQAGDLGFKLGAQADDLGFELRAQAGDLGFELGAQPSEPLFHALEPFIDSTEAGVDFVAQSFDNLVDVMGLVEQRTYDNGTEAQDLRPALKGWTHALIVHERGRNASAVQGKRISDKG